jgi:hypothetical protein
MRAKITVHSIYDVRVSHTTYEEIDENDVDENGQINSMLYRELWQDAVNDFCSDTVIEVVSDED